MDLKRLEQALINADAAGDVEAARMLAAEIQRVRPKTAAQDTGSFEAFKIGAGRAADRLIEGGKQGAMGIGAIFSELLPDSMKQQAQGALTEKLVAQEADQRDKTARYAQLEKERPYATTSGEISALVAAPMLRPLSGASTASTILNTGVSGALPGLLEYGTAQERSKRGATGGAGGVAGGVVGNVIGRALNPVRPNLTQTQQAAQDAAGRLGVTLSPGEMTGSRPLRWAEAALADLPFSSGMEQARQKANEKAMATGAAKALGETAEEITPDVLANARVNIGQRFQNLIQSRDIPLDKTFRAEVQNITGSKVMQELRNDSVEPLLNRFRNMPQGKISVDGDWFQQNKTALDMAIREAYGASQNGKAQALERLEKAFDGALRRSMSKTEQASYDAAQKQWASLRLMETGQVVKDGRIMPAALDSAMKNRYKDAYREGKLSGELPDIASLGSTLRPMPNSGTTPRALYSGAAGGMAMLEPATAATMMAAPPALQKLMQSEAGKRYLTQGLFSVTPEMERLLMLGGGGLLSAGALAAN